MADDQRFSVYNVPTGDSTLDDNPLAHLTPANRDTGWHVARNLLKPLNHLDFLRRKDEIAQLLNLHNLKTPVSKFGKPGRRVCPRFVRSGPNQHSR